MSFRELQKRLQQRPLKPFRVVLSSGDTYEARHPEMALLLQGGIEIAAPNAKGEPPEAAACCSLLHITAIEPIAAKNGRHSRKK